MLNQHKVLHLNNHICSFSDKTELQHMAECSPCLASTIQLSVLRTGIYSPGLCLSLQGWGAAQPHMPQGVGTAVVWASSPLWACLVHTRLKQWKD